jgi:hypothetical protein
MKLSSLSSSTFKFFKNVNFSIGTNLSPIWTKIVKNPKTQQVIYWFLLRDATPNIFENILSFGALII